MSLSDIISCVDGQIAKNLRLCVQFYNLAFFHAVRGRKISNKQCKSADEIQTARAVPQFSAAQLSVFLGRESEELIRDGQVARSMHARRDLSECTAATDGSAAVD